MMKTFITNDYPMPWQLGFQNPATPVMEGIINLHNYIFMYLILVTVVVSWFLFRSLYLFRKSQNAEPMVFNHDPVIETIWTIAPAFILVAIAIPSFSLLYSMDEVINPGLTVKAIGHQWYWSYELDACRKDGVFDYVKVKHPFFTKLSIKEISKYHHGFIKIMKDANIEFDKRVKNGKLLKSGEFIMTDEVWEWDDKLRMDVLLKWGKEIWASNPSTSVKSVDKNIEVEYVNWKKQHESFKLSKSGLKFTNTLKAFYKPAAKPVAFSLTEAIDNPIGLRNKSATKMVKRMTPFEIAFKFKPKIVKYKTLAELKVEKLANSGKQKNLKPNEIDSFRLFKLSYPQFVFSPYTLTVLPKTNFITANIDPVVNHNFSILKYLFSDFISYKRFKYISAFEFTTTRYRWGHSIMWVSPPIKIDSYMLPENALPKGGLRLLEVDNRLILPINTNIRVLVTSTDVIHSWSIPSLGIKLDAVPGRLNQTALFIKRTGVFYGQCSELCGINHGFMPIVVEAVSTRDFNKWVLEMSNPRRLEDLVNSSDWQVRVTKRFY